MYSLTKFARLAAGGNPTILHFLFVRNLLGPNPVVGLRCRPREQLSGQISFAQIHRLC
jgi:hypothetical protein